MKKFIRLSETKAKQAIIVDDEDDNYTFCYSDNGCFYFKDYEKRQEKKMFTLPKFLNTQNIIDKILNILKEEMKN